MQGDDDGGDGYFQPQASSSWLQDDQQALNPRSNQASQRGQRDRQSLDQPGNGNPRSSRSGEVASQYANDTSSRSNTSMPRQLRASNTADFDGRSTSSSSSRSLRDEEGDGEDWGEQDGYFQPDAEPPASRRSSSRQQQRGTSPQQRSGWQPSTEDWD